MSRRPVVFLGLIALLLAMIAWPVSGRADPPKTGAAGVMAALDNILTLDRPHQIALATVWDGNKYVQCGRLSSHALRCEAAGARMQPSLAHILTPERVERLTALGWSLDPSFGQYAQTIPAGTPTDQIAAKIIETLAAGYDADVANLEVSTDWIASEPCPPRNGPSQNLAGMINDAPIMAASAVHACAYAPNPAFEAAPAALSVVNLISLYGPRVSGEIQRLRINARREVFFVLDTATGYIQCRPDQAAGTIYCEAQSADEWPVLASVLTAERLAVLHAAGYTDPGRAPNYAKSYPVAALDDAAMASELLTLLHDVYGYGGTPVLAIETEKGG